MLAARCFLGVWPGELFLGHEHLVIRPVEDGSEEASVDRALIQHDRIFLVVPGVGCNGNDRVAAGSKFLEAEILHALCGDQRLLRIVKHVGERIHAHLVVRGIDTHGLFAHCALISVPR